MSRDCVLHVNIDDDGQCLSLAYLVTGKYNYLIFIFFLLDLHHWCSTAPRTVSTPQDIVLETPVWHNSRF
ncbi:hypothetical protein K439DRAFT_1074800 [Ramaria rubella]|nr:hypothetical protein K439DRAFT_1074800 [Ramaria rubella]